MAPSETGATQKATRLGRQHPGDAAERLRAGYLRLSGRQILRRAIRNSVVWAWVLGYGAVTGWLGGSICPTPELRLLGGCDVMGTLQKYSHHKETACGWPARSRS